MSGSRLLVGWLLAILGTTGCGGDDPAGPTPGEAADLVRSLNPAFRAGVVAALDGGGRAAGASGALVVEGDRWRFDGYSPDGQVFVDGELRVDSDGRPMLVRGALDLSGDLAGVLAVDLAYNVTNGIISGTLTVAGVAVSVSHRLCCPED